MPFTFWCFVIAALSISGVPLFNGFISKSITISAAAAAHYGSVELLLQLAGVGTFLSIALKMIYFIFLAPDNGVVIKREVPEEYVCSHGYRRDSVRVIRRLSRAFVQVSALYDGTIPPLYGRPYYSVYRNAGNGDAAVHDVSAKNGAAYSFITGYRLVLPEAFCGHRDRAVLSVLCSKSGAWQYLGGII